MSLESAYWRAVLPNLSYCCASALSRELCEKHDSLLPSNSHNTPMKAGLIDPIYFFPHLFLKIFFMWTIFKVFIEFLIIFPLFYVLVFWLKGMCNLTSLTRD